MRNEPERNAALWDNQRYAFKAFKDLGFEIGNTETPIIPLFIRDNTKTFTITHDLLEDGVFVTPVIAPAVPNDETLIRVALMATHTHEQIDIAVEKIHKAFKKLQVL
jgi:8-amino-7-oxononanoate synthase